jgi:hypothetical protein
MLGKLMLGNMADQADVGPGCPHRLTIEGEEVAAVPSTAEQGREMTLLAPEHLKDGSELLGEQEEAAVGGRLFIPQSMDEAAG